MNYTTIDTAIISHAREPDAEAFIFVHLSGKITEE